MKQKDVFFNMICYNLSMGERVPAGRTPRSIRRLGAHGSDLPAGQKIEFGSPLPKVPKDASLPTVRRRRKLSQEEAGEGFFPDKSLKNPRRIEIPQDPERPHVRVWVKAGAFSTAPINSDEEDHAGTLEGRAMIASPGKRLKFVGYGGIGSFTGRVCEVTDDKDIRFLRTSGWWTRSQLSDESKPGEKPKEPESDKLF